MRFMRNWAVSLAAIAASATSAAAEPRYVIYYGAPATPLTHAAQADYTHVNIAFATVAAVEADTPIALVEPDFMADQWDAVADLQASGQSVLISFGGGAMDAPAWASLVGREAELAARLADLVATRGLNGVDIDFEISPSLTQSTSRPFDGVAFLIALTTALHEALPDDMALSHAPQAPYLSQRWHGAPYLDVMREVGDQIDWLLVQYYNNPGFDAPVAAEILGTAQDPIDSSVAGMIAGAGGYALAANQIVVGLPVYHADAANGHLPPETVRSDILLPLSDLYGDAFGGLMGWQFSDLTDDHRYWNDQMATGTALGAEQSAP